MDQEQNNRIAKLWRRFINVRAIGPLLSRFMGMGLQFVSVLVIARALGAADMGLFSLYSSFLVLISAFIGFGSPVHSFTLVSKLHIKEDWVGIWSYFLSFIKAMASIAVLLAFLYQFLKYIEVNPKEVYWTVIPYSLVGAVVFVLLRNAFEFMQAMSKTTIAMSLENILSPVTMIAFILLSGLLGLSVMVNWLMILNITIFFTLAVAMFYMTVQRPNTRTLASNNISSKLFTKSTLPLWLSSILDMAFVNVPTILAAKLGTLDDVGRFSIAFRFIAIIASLLMVVRGTLGRDLIKHYQAKDFESCISSMRAMQKFGLIIYVPVMSVFVFGGDALLDMFGKSFDGAYDYLLILGAGQLIYAAFGFSGFALVAIDESRFEAIFSLICMGVLLGVAWVLKDYSARGVAVAYCVSISLRSFIPYVYAQRKINKLIQEI